MASFYFKNLNNILPSDIHIRISGYMRAFHDKKKRIGHYAN